MNLSDMEEAEKVKKVVRPIKTIEQANAALNYVLLWQSKYTAHQRITNPVLSDCDSFCRGYLLGFIGAAKANDKQE